MGGRFDVLVAGSGIAGLSAALHAVEAGARVAVITKGAVDEGASRWAQGGIAAAVALDDSPDQHLADTMAAGAGLCDEAAVRVLVEEGPRRVRELIEWGVAFDTQDGVLLTGREAAHSRPRILHARGDATGLEIETALIRRLRASGAAIRERHHATRLAVADGRCAGIEVCAPDGSPEMIASGSVILATGGAGRLWLQTTNPPPATGDGVGLGYDAGADVAGLEFMQFHPTALALEGAPRFLISEAVRGEGAVIVNEAGERFLFGADERGELASRDVVSQAIWAELRRSGSGRVYLDCSPLSDRAAIRFPTIHRTCLAHGIDITRDPIPVAPAAHYLIGGVRTDLDGATTVPGLFACGEVASSGVHGANRLASNSLLESVVFARRAALAALGSGAPVMRPPGTMPPGGRPSGSGGEAPAGWSAEEDGWGWKALRTAMWDGAGVVRDAAGLRAALEVIDRLGDPGPPAPASAAAAGGPRDQLAAIRSHLARVCARLSCEAALAREESRGCHLRSDFPGLSDNWHGLRVMNTTSGAHFDSHG